MREGIPLTDFDWISWAIELISFGCDWLSLEEHEHDGPYIRVIAGGCKYASYIQYGNVHNAAILEYAIREAIEAEGWVWIASPDWSHDDNKLTVTQDSYEVELITPHGGFDSKASTVIEALAVAFAEAKKATR